MRDDRATALALTALLIVTAFVAGIGPRVFTVIARDALRSEIAAARASARNVALIEERRVVGRPGAPLSGVETLGARREERIPDGVRPLIADRAFVVDSPRWTVVSETLPRSTIAFRFQPGAEERIRLVDGRLPTGATRTIEVPLPGPFPEPVPGEPAEPPPTIELPVLEIAVPVAAADLLRIRPGDTIELLVDGTDRLARFHEDRLAVDVVGTYEVADPADDFWLEDQALARPSVREISSENAYFDATALLAPDAYVELWRATDSSQLPLRYTWRYFIDPERLDVETVEAVLADLRRLESQFPTSISAGAVPETVLRTDLVRLVDTQRTRWRSAEALLTVMVVGPGAVAGAAIALVAVLAAQRRRPSLAVWRSRGASLGQIVAATIAEGVLLAAPAATIAGLAAVALIPDAGGGPTLVAVTAVGAAAVALILVAVARAAVGEGDGRAREGVVARGPAQRRIVVEALVVVLAVAGGFLLRERGVRGASSTGELVAADPFIAAVPVLVGLAAGILAIRLVPLPIAALAGLAATRRDLVPVLGLRRATRAGTPAVLLVLLATTAVAGFASAALAHLDRSAEAVAWQEVGAPYRLANGGRTVPALDAGEVPVDAAAGALEATVPLGANGALLRADLLALDATAFEAVARGGPNAAVLPAALLAEADGPIPAILGPRLGEGSSGVEPGEVFELSIDGSRVRARAIEFRATFPGAPLGGRFVVLSRDQLQALRPDDPFPTTSVFIRPPDGTDPAAFVEAIARAAPGTILESRADRAVALRSGPIPVAVGAGVAVAALVAGAYAGLALVVALALAGAARSGEIAHLRTLGLGRRQGVGLLVVEHGPVIGLAFAAGAALGFGLFAVLRPGLGLEGIIGSPLDVPVRIEPVQVGLLLVAIIGLGSLGIAIAVRLQRQLALSMALRRGIE